MSCVTKIDNENKLGYLTVKWRSATEGQVFDSKETTETDGPFTKLGDSNEYWIIYLVHVHFQDADRRQVVPAADTKTIYEKGWHSLATLRPDVENIDVRFTKKDVQFRFDLTKDFGTTGGGSVRIAKARTVGGQGDEILPSTIRAAIYVYKREEGSYGQHTGLQTNSSSSLLSSNAAYRLPSSLSSMQTVSSSFMRDALAGLAREAAALTQQRRSSQPSPSAVVTMQRGKRPRDDAASVASTQASTTMASSQDGSRCVICLDHRSRVIFIPCGHKVTCKHCSPRVDKCPVCRGQIQLKQRVHL